MPREKMTFLIADRAWLEDAGLWSLPLRYVYSFEVRFYQLVSGDKAFIARQICRWVSWA